MLLGMPAPYLEVRLLFTLVVSIEVSGAENTQLVLTTVVVVGELIGIVRPIIVKLRITNSHYLGVASASFLLSSLLVIRSSFLVCRGFEG